MQRVFIDGQAGTTGLEIASRLRSRSDIELLEIADAARKSPTERAAYLNAADLVVLCLPDDAAQQAMTLLDDPNAKVLDASTAHRVADGWCYGLAELQPGQRQRITESNRVSNPGCYATGFILAVRPLIEAGLIEPGTRLSTFAVSGYSGGGRSMIERYQAGNRHPTDPDPALEATRSYGLTMTHKHLPEMRCYSGTGSTPLFTPMVASFYKGMLVHVPLTQDQFPRATGSAEVRDVLAAYYEEEPCIRVADTAEAWLDDGYLSPVAANDSNRVDLMVFGDEQQVLVVARYDNLGKGASGAAVQNLNLMLGRPELCGLAL